MALVIVVDRILGTVRESDPASVAAAAVTGEIMRVAEVTGKAADFSGTITFSSALPAGTNFLINISYVNDEADGTSYGWEVGASTVNGFDITLLGIAGRTAKIGYIILKKV